MNKIKGVFVAILILGMSVPCFGNGVVIKRKKKKWNHSIEQKMTDVADVSQETTALFF